MIRIDKDIHITITMIRIAIIAFSMFLFWGCGSAPEAPKDIMPMQKMKLVLWDLIRADELTYVRAGTDTTATKLANRVTLYQQVLQIHKITREQFKKSLSYYQSHPDLMKIVIDSMYNKATTSPSPSPKM